MSLPVSERGFDAIFTVVDRFSRLVRLSTGYVGLECQRRLLVIGTLDFSHPFGSPLCQPWVRESPLVRLITPRRMG